MCCPPLVRGGVLGCATLPDGAAGGSGDGVVMLHKTIGGKNNGYGNFNERQTLVHEVGHYLGLRHAFNPTGACRSYTYGADNTPQLPGLPIWLLYEATQP